MADKRTAYRWKGDLFCDGDIVDTMLDDSPWDAWLGENPRPHADANVEDVLDQIAVYFSINRNNRREVESMGFPVRLRGAPKPPQFCRGCLRWFS
jgi:hypothetical protein